MEGNHKKWKNFQKLIEQLRQEITGSNRIIEETELSFPRTIGSFGKQQGRILDAFRVLAEDS